MPYSALVRGVLNATGLVLVLVALGGNAFAGAPLSGDAPEIDPGSALSALTLLSGGLMVLTDRRRRANEAK